MRRESDSSACLTAGGCDGVVYDGKCRVQRSIVSKNDLAENSEQNLSVEPCSFRAGH